MKILLIGFGSIARRHFKLLVDNPIVSEVNIVSRYSDSDQVLYKSLSDIPDDKLQKYDVFFICSETHMHGEQLKYLDGKISNKTIVVEKPLSSVKMVYAPKNSVFVAYNMRFHPVIQKLNVMLSGQKILHFSARCGQFLPTWRTGSDYKKSYSYELNKGGGVLRDLSHEIDYTYWLCGDFKLKSALSGALSSLHTKSDDVTTILAESGDGAHIQIQMDYLSFRPKRNIEIQTDSITVYACLIENKIDVYDIHGHVETILFEELTANYSYTAMHEDILSGNNSVSSTFEEANKTMGLIDTITEKYMNKNWDT